MKSRESLIAELDARKIGYKDEMTYKEISDLLEKAREEAEKKMSEAPLHIDYSGVRCGLSTIHDLHRRITILERKAKDA